MNDQPTVEEVAFAARVEAWLKAITMVDAYSVMLARDQVRKSRRS